MRRLRYSQFLSSFDRLPTVCDDNSRSNGFQKKLKDFRVSLIKLQVSRPRSGDRVNIGLKTMYRLELFEDPINPATRWTQL